MINDEDWICAPKLVTFLRGGDEACTVFSAYAIWRVQPFCEGRIEVTGSNQLSATLSLSVWGQSCCGHEASFLMWLASPPSTANGHHKSRSSADCDITESTGMATVASRVVGQWSWKEVALHGGHDTAVLPSTCAHDLIKVLRVGRRTAEPHSWRQEPYPATAECRVAEFLSHLLDSSRDRLAGLVSQEANMSFIEVVVKCSDGPRVTLLIHQQRGSPLAYLGLVLIPLHRLTSPSGTWEVSVLSSVALWRHKPEWLAPA